MSRTPTAPAAPAPARPVAAPVVPERNEVTNQAIEELLLAREQARLGLMDDAQAAWNRALSILAPLAAADPHVAEQVRAIETERDRAMKAAEVRADIADADNDADATDQTAEKILEEAEPQLDPSKLPDVGKAAQEVTPDYPVVLNDRVYAWIEAWTGPLRHFFTGSLERSGQYTERFRQIFAEEGLPQDLVYLAHVESGFKTTAYSSAAARGIFQFIAETGRRYGLVANWWLDERADPEKSCRASAAYLRDLYAEFGDWYMAMAAYNAGEGKVRDVIARTGNKDFFAPENQRLFVSATRNYVPAILAATLIAKNPGKFGFADVKPMEPQRFEIVTVPTPTSLDVLAQVANASAETLKALNPSLRRHSTPPAYKDFILKVPAGAAEGFVERLAKIPVDQRLVEQEHVVRRGETLTTIARRYGVSTRSIAQANGLGRRPRLHGGQVLVIPDGPEAAPDPLLDRPGRAGATFYVVKRGDHISGIARRFHVSVKQLQAWNKLGKSMRVSRGQRLRVAPPADVDTKVASGRTKGAKGTKDVAEVESAAPAKGGSHVVRRGETLARISKKYGISQDDLAAANRLGRGARIRPGQKLVIPAKGAASEASPAPETRGASTHGAVRSPARPTKAAAKPANVAAKRHVVKRGETLSAIARRFNTSVDKLCELNSISPRARLNAGDSIAVAGP